MKNNMNLYIIIFDNGKMYVGMTTRKVSYRIKEHERKSFKYNSMLAVHCSMRIHKYKYIEFDTMVCDVDFLREIEKEIIAYLKECGFTLYNMTDGGEGIVNLPSDRRKEISRKRSRPIEWYEVNPVERHIFRKACKIHGFDILYFEEIHAGKKVDKRNRSSNLFFYKYIGEYNDNPPNPKIGDISYFETNPVQKNNFKRACKNHGWDFCDFEETRVSTKDRKMTLYTFKYIGKDNENKPREYENVKNRIVRVKDELYYETCGVRRCHFKRACALRGWNFDDFEEIFDGDFYICNNIKHKKYFYKKVVDK